MKHLLKAIFTFLVALLFKTVTAQTSGPVIKFDLNGKPVSFKADEIINYNQFVPGDDYEQTGNRHVLSATYAPKSPYKLQIVIFTAPHTNPTIGKIPFAAEEFLRINQSTPAVYLNLAKKVINDHEFYFSKLPDAGSFEITKVAAGWVEGKFQLDMPNQFKEDGEVLHITNGFFRFKIEKEEQD